MIVPGSGLVKQQAEAEGLDAIFKAAGFEWREPGCSMCLGMNPDQLAAARALRLDLEPQFRGAAGPARPHPSRLAGHGGGRGDRRPLRRYPQFPLSRVGGAMISLVQKKFGEAAADYAASTVHAKGESLARLVELVAAEALVARARCRDRGRPYRTHLCAAA